MFLFATIVGGFMGYAYLSGKTAEAIVNLDKRVDALERADRDRRR